MKGLIIFAALISLTFASYEGVSLSDDDKGYVEVAIDGDQGYVCGGFNDDVADVICRSLGYDGGSVASDSEVDDLDSADDDTDVLIQDVDCDGDEGNLGDCQYDEFDKDEDDCDDIGAVVCDGDSIEEKTEKSQELAKEVAQNPQALAMVLQMLGQTDERVRAKVGQLTGTGEQALQGLMGFVQQGLAARIAMGQGSLAKGMQYGGQGQSAVEQLMAMALQGPMPAAPKAPEVSAAVEEITEITEITEAGDELTEITEVEEVVETVEVPSLPVQPQVGVPNVGQPETNQFLEARQKRAKRNAKKAEKIAARKKAKKEAQM